MQPLYLSHSLRPSNQLGYRPGRSSTVGYQPSSVFDEFRDRLPGLWSGNSHTNDLRLDLDVHTGRQNELGKIVYRLLGGVCQINEPFVNPNLELLARFFVHVR